MLQLSLLLPCKSANVNQTLITILDQCKSMLELKQIQALITTLGLSQDDPFVSKILSFSALSERGDINYSYKLFSQLPNPKTFNWNTIIRGYSNSKNPNLSISVFVKMLRAGVSPDYLTYPFLVKASSRLLKWELGVAVHAHVMKTGFESDMFIQNSLIHMYASCGDIVYARKVFDGMLIRNLVSWNAMLDGHAKCGDVISARGVFELMPERDVVSWSSLIDGYVKNGEYREAISVFEKMCGSGPKANEVTMVSVLCACAHLGALEPGRMMHQYIIDNGLRLPLVLQTSLVDMYAKCGAIAEALNVFRGVRMSRTDVLIWNAIIGGLATHGLVKESLELLTEMQIVGITPDETLDTQILVGAAVALVAIGAGAVARAILENPEDKTKVHLIYANVTYEDILLKQELDGLATNYPDRFKIYYVLNQPPEVWHGGVGFVSKEMIQTHCPAPASDIQ
ncbi:pentatricopeptide repeat-containing protein At5g08305, partial [Fagus crenata]